MIFLDTNVAIAAMSDRPPQIADTIAARRAQSVDVAISSIVLFELRFGIVRSHRKQFNETRLRHFLRNINIVPFEADDALSAGALRASLAAAGTPIGPYDVLIAGQALRRGATLVTRNVREFGRVEGLMVEDWARG